MAGHNVKSGSVTLTVKPWRHPSGRDYFRASYHCPQSQKLRHVTRSTLAKAKEAAFQKAKAIQHGELDLSSLEPRLLRSIKRMLEADPQLALVDEFLLWKAKKHPEKATNAAIVEFLAVKESNSGLSTQNVKTLKKHLTPFSTQFEDTPLSAITAPMIEQFLVSKPWANRTRRNIRASIVTFFRWCRSSEYLPEGETAAEKTETPIVTDTIPETYEPHELRLMLDAVKTKYLPWLALGAFAGIRTDEISPIAGSSKSPLDWSDFKWDRDIIIVRPATAKTKRRRVVPIHPALRSWLFPICKKSGPALSAPPPTKRGRGKGAEAETVRLGKLVGGWRSNALRDSYISYRAAQVGLGKTAMEAGNSEQEAKKSYNDAKSEDEGNEWFSLFPKCSQFPESAKDREG